MAEILESDVSGSGVWQGDLVKVLANLRDVANELQTDHGTVKTFIDELKTDYELLRSQMLNRCVQACGLAEGTNANTIKTANAVSFVVNGQLYTKGATDNIAMTAAAQQAISTYCLYLVSIVAGGTVTVTKGTSVATDTAVLPALPADSAPLGFFKVVTDGSTTFTSGTTDLGAAGLTVTYGDLSVVNSGTSASTTIAATAVASLTNSTAITLNKG